MTLYIVDDGMMNKCGEVGVMRICKKNVQVFGVILSHCRFVYHKFHMARSEVEHGTRQWKSGDESHEIWHGP
jgi:hypothetical protein